MRRTTDFSLLDEFIIKRKIKWENERVTLLKQTFKALEVLSRKYNFTKAYIFGSIIKSNKFLPNSDIDIAIINLKDKYFFSCMAELSQILKRDVEIAQLENHRLKDKIIKEGLLWKRRD